MASLSIRKLPDEVHRTLRIRAAQNDNSTEAEARAILKSAVQPEARIKLGSMLAELGREVGLAEEEFAIFQQVRDRTPAEPVKFA